MAIVRSFISPSIQYPIKDLSGQTAVITGGCSGIGKNTAAHLLNMNATVILGCRNVSDSICNGLYAPSRCNTYPVDLSSFNSVRKFNWEIEKSGYVPNILVNNAGIRHNRLIITDDKIESHFQVNYLSHFLLVHLLLPLMSKSIHPIRVIHVSSSAHKFGIIDKSAYNIHVKNTNSSIFDNIQGVRLEGVYGDTKLMQVMFSNELQKRFEKSSFVTKPLSLAGFKYFHFLYINIYFLQFCFSTSWIRFIKHGQR